MFSLSSTGKKTLKYELAYILFVAIEIWFYISLKCVYIIFDILIKQTKLFEINLILIFKTLKQDFWSVSF